MSLAKMETVWRVAEKISRLTSSCGAVFLVALMFLITVHVVGRYLLSLPVPGSVELIEFMLLIIVFMGMAECETHGDNVSVDLLVTMLPERTQTIIGFCTSILSAAIVILITWQSALQTKILWASGSVSGVLHIPRFPFAAVMVLAWGMFAIVLLLRVFEFLWRVFKK